MVVRVRVYRLCFSTSLGGGVPEVYPLPRVYAMVPKLVVEQCGRLSRGLHTPILVMYLMDLVAQIINNLARGMHGFTNLRRVLSEPFPPFGREGRRSAGHAQSAGIPLTEHVFLGLIKRLNPVITEVIRECRITLLPSRLPFRYGSVHR